MKPSVTLCFLQAKRTAARAQVHPPGASARINPFNMPGENSPPSKKARRGSPVLPVDADLDGVLHDQEEDDRQPSPPHPSTGKRVIWRVPETSHTGSCWQIIDGFATPEECRALVADAKQGLADSLRQPLRRFEDPPLVGVKYRSADASSLASEALAALSARAANVTCVGVNKEKDSVMIAHTSARVTTTTRAAVLPGDEKDENADVGKEPGGRRGRWGRCGEGGERGLRRIPPPGGSRQGRRRLSMGEARERPPRPQQGRASRVHGVCVPQRR